MNKRTLLVLAGLLSTGQAQADVIWDEVVDGDLSNIAGQPTIIERLSIDDQVIGTVGGDDLGEFRDVFTFDVPFGFGLEAILLNDYIAAGGNSTTGFTLFTEDTGHFGSLISTLNLGQSNIGDNTFIMNTPSGCSLRVVTA